MAGCSSKLRKRTLVSFQILPRIYKCIVLALKSSERLGRWNGINFSNPFYWHYYGNVVSFEEVLPLISIRIRSGTTSTICGFDPHDSALCCLCGSI